MGDNRLPFSSAKIVPAATMLLAIAVTLAVLVDQTVGHVALTFPPARKYDLDFLDNSRTKGPCGMPKGKQRDSERKIGCNIYGMIRRRDGRKDHQR